jgi:hypothetical protein
MIHQYEILCSGECGIIVCFTFSSQPLPGLYCWDCVEAAKEKQETEESEAA